MLMTGCWHRRLEEGFDTGTRCSGAALGGIKTENFISQPRAALTCWKRWTKPPKQRELDSCLRFELAISNVPLAHQQHYVLIFTDPSVTDMRNS